MTSGPSFNPVFAGLGTTIFSVMSALALEHQAINLGQGFPDEDGPHAIRAVAAQALRDGPNQYPPTRGVPALRAAIAAHARRFYGFSFDPETEVLVTSGATEALACCIYGLAGPGKEVVLIEPAYDSYRPIAQSAGAKVRSVILEPPDFRLTYDGLAAAVTEKTTAVLVNTPLNPLGRVFSRAELEILAEVVGRSNAAVVADEVYEHLTFDGRSHISPLAIAGLKDRVLRVGSAGKMFSLTGWKIGWVTGPAALVDIAAKAHQFLTFTTSPALQLGIAHGLERQIDFTLGLRDELEAKRDLLARELAALGFELLPCEGTYFLTASIRALTQESDRDFCLRLVREAKVALVPLSPFFEAGKPDHLVRFAFCKKADVLREAIVRLQNYLGKRKV
ncbi:MAG: aminotransferase [Alphaproteobacteria bacterium]|nr:aminotransferase [Alphaproteobacteria bacterium]